MKGRFALMIGLLFAVACVGCGSKEEEIPTVQGSGKAPGSEGAPPKPAGAKGAFSADAPQ
ncbi:hypothetical protein EON81_21020 [bacterium]|nr:MAG: hypothetical protein EON81_21020 [bacterium]